MVATYTKLVAVHLTPEMDYDLGELALAMQSSKSAIVRIATKQFLIDNAATLRRYRREKELGD